MDLAKPALDVGLYTNQLDPMLAFWQDQVGLVFNEMLPLGGGMRQHRHAIGDSVLKVNHTREALPASPPTGLRSLDIFSSAVDAPSDLLDPEGNEIHLLPVTQSNSKQTGQTNLQLNLVVSDLAAHQRFYGDTLGLNQFDENKYAVGASVIHLSEGAATTPAERTGTGFRYMTFQVFDVIGTHKDIIQSGGTEGMAPLKLGEVAYISFVRDPDGNWIEISQRKSITGSLD